MIHSANTDEPAPGALTGQGLGGLRGFIYFFCESATAPLFGPHRLWAVVGQQTSWPRVAWQPPGKKALCPVTVARVTEAGRGLWEPPPHRLSYCPPIVCRTMRL